MSNVASQFPNEWYVSNSAYLGYKLPFLESFLGVNFIKDDNDICSQIAEDLAPMEFTSYRVTTTNVPPPRRIAGSTLKWNYNPYQGMLTIKRGHKSEPVNIKNEFLYYLGHDGDNQKFENRYLEL